MAIWVCRTGDKGQYGQKFLEENCICLTREGLNFDISKADKEKVLDTLLRVIPDAARQTISNTWSQIDIFANKMAIGDYVLIPKKKSMLVTLAKIESDYLFSASLPFPDNHKRTIRIIENDIDTSVFSQDLKYSLGAFRTIFEVKKVDRLVQELRKVGVRLDEI